MEKLISHLNGELRFSNPTCPCKCHQTVLLEKIDNFTLFCFTTNKGRNGRLVN